MKIRVPSSWVRCGKMLLAQTAPSVTAAVVTVGPFSLDRVSAAQNADPRIVSTRQQVIDGDPVTDPVFVKMKSQLVVHDGMLFRSVKLPPNDAVVIPVIPSSLESDVVHAAHVNCGHACVEGTWRFLRSKCYFPNMTAQCQQFVRHCLLCAAASPTKGILAEASRPVVADGPWSVVEIDTPELGVDQSGEYHCVLVCMDTFTKWVEVVPLCQHDAASVAEAFVGLCTRWGPPQVVHCDNGTGFINAVMSSLFDTFGVTVLNGAVHHPQSQGSVERFTPTLLTSIRKVLDEADDWRSELDELLYFYRIRPHSVLKISPMRVMLGWEPTGVLFSASPGLGLTPPNLERQAARIRDFVEAELSSKDFVESEADNCVFAVGDEVLLRRSHCRQKCEPPYERDWVVIHIVSPSTVVIRNEAGGGGDKVVNVELLKPDAVADVPVADAVADVPAPDAVADVSATDAVSDVPDVIDVPATGAAPDAGSWFDPCDPNYVPLRAPADDPAPYQFRPYGLRQRGSLTPLSASVSFALLRYLVCVVVFCLAYHQAEK